jgi:hypothetical protein
MEDTNSILINNVMIHSLTHCNFKVLLENLEVRVFVYYKKDKEKKNIYPNIRLYLLMMA